MSYWKGIRPAHWQIPPQSHSKPWKGFKEEHPQKLKQLMHKVWYESFWHFWQFLLLTYLTLLTLSTLLWLWTLLSLLYFLLFGHLCKFWQFWQISHFWYFTCDTVDIFQKSSQILKKSQHLKISLTILKDLIVNYNLATKFVTYTSCTRCWSTLEPMQVVPPDYQILNLCIVVPLGGPICNWCKWHHLVAEFATYAKGTIWLPNL